MGFTIAAAVVGTTGAVCLAVGWKYGEDHKKTKGTLEHIKTGLEAREAHIDM